MEISWREEYIHAPKNLVLAVDFTFNSKEDDWWPKEQKNYVYFSRNVFVYFV
jgi:hypothetical protein